VIAIANSLRMDVLAEGVETDLQRQKLLRLGCKMMQGYYFHRPMSAHKTGLLLQGKLVEEQPSMQTRTKPSQKEGDRDEHWDHSMTW
jgi:EAL domain-containing protein (putative c-di-GMP-specific phosphodiesterase class I)